MKFNLMYEGVELNQHQSDYAEKKFENLHKYSHKITEEEMTVDLKVVFSESFKQDEKYKLRVMLTVPRASFLAEVQSIEFEEGVDLLHDKLKRQIDRFKSKFIRMHRQNSVRDSVVDNHDVLSALSEDDGLDTRVNKRKLFNHLIPMTETEAIDQMEMLGHGFFLFVNQATDRYNLVYKRPNTGGYAVVELEHEVGVLK